MWIALAIVSGLGGEPGVAPTAEANEVHLAYLDPGSGSFMVQALIAALAGIGVAGRRYWTQIKTWLGLQNRSADDEFDPDDD
jgi:hypothetical protein